MEGKKTLCVFDMDRTITNEDSMDVTSKYLLNYNQLDSLDEAAEKYENWCDTLNFFFQLIKSNKKGITEIKNALSKVELSKGMNRLFNYLRRNEDKYESIIISSGNIFCINEMLKFHHIDDLIKEIIANRTKIINDTLIVSEANSHNCDMCCPSICKTKELELYFKKNPRHNYKRVVFTCDGYNDLCLVRALEKNDCCVLRKNYDLYQALFIDKVNVKTKCKFFTWTTGYDIINILERIKKF
jgi:2,3-diketo-5-methylthio-1-phosphopentane phosphatase